MPEFSGTINVNAPQNEVIDFVSSVDNMPKYLPTVKNAKMLDEDTVHMEVEIKGEHHEDSGYLRRNGDTLEWGSEDHDYKGSMEIKDSGEGSEVTISLHMNPPKDMLKEMEQEHAGEWEKRIQESLEQALQMIKSNVEEGSVGRG